MPESPHTGHDLTKLSYSLVTDTPLTLLNTPILLQVSKPKPVEQNKYII